jgi:hypothetical protein
MAETYPESLPCFLFEGYVVTPRNPVLEIDHGLAVRRRQVYSDMREQISVGLVLSAAQEITFRELYNVTLEMGALTFDAPIQFKGSLQTIECQFIGDPPSYSPVAPGYVRATATLLTAE